MCARADTINRLSGFHGRLNEAGTPPTSGENEKNQGRGPKAEYFRLNNNEEAVPIPREIECSHTGSASGTTVLPQPPSRSGQSPNCGSPGLLCASRSHPQHEGGASVVGGAPLTMEWRDSSNRETLSGHRDRCVKKGLGSNLPRGPDGGTLVEIGVQHAHQLPGSAGSHQVFCLGSQKCDDPAQNGQHECRHICEQAWRHSVTELDSHNQESMALVPAERYISHSGTPTGSTEHDCRRGIAHNEGQNRLETEPRGVQADKQAIGSSNSGSVRISPDNSATTLLQLEARPRGRSPECVLPTMGQARGEGIRQPSVEPGGKNPVPGTSSRSNHSVDRSSVEDTGVVRNSPGDVGRLPCDTQTSRRADTANNTNSGTRSGTSTSRVAYLRRHYEDEQISDTGTELLLASWRTKSSKSYDSLFGKWVCWCHQRGADPIDGPISDVVNFLAHVYDEGYQYRSLNSYRSAISSVHTKVDGHSVGEHPLVARLLKGVFNQRPPRPRYETTWDVAQVTEYLEKMGENSVLTLQELYCKCFCFFFV